MSRGMRAGEAKFGYLFVAPAVIIIGVFLVAPIFLALWVSFSDWNGLGSPLGNSQFIGTENYEKVLVDDGLSKSDFGTSIRNTFYYVIFVVPAQTALALFLAVQVNRRVLRGRGFFRTAFYFPSVTSSIAITTIFLFLFTASGVVNSILSFFGINGPNWFKDPSGVIHNLLGVAGVTSAPAFLDVQGPLGVSWWQWLAGPSVAMCALIALAVFTTSGTFMLLFLAALQNIGAEIDEAALMDGSGPFRKFFSVTLPMLKPTLFTVLTLGLIGTWQVFDQVYLTGGNGAPAKTLLTPAFLAFSTSFNDLKWGQGAAISFILFAIIVALTLLQRAILRDRDVGKRAEANATKAAVLLKAGAARASAAGLARAGAHAGTRADTRDDTKNGPTNDDDTRKMGI